MKILVIEDEIKIRNFLKTTLEAECFVVDTASDGEKGLELARKNPYNLVIANNLLPKRNGIEICVELRKIGKNMPIFILSVQNHTLEKVDLLDAGADDYLTKPFALEEFLARVRALLRRKEMIRPETLSVGDLVLNSKEGVVTKKKESVPLTRKEFMLLKYLMENAGMIVSKNMILDHVWDMSVDLFSNTIESHILSLRRKLKDRGRVRMIQTFSGRGYKIQN